MRENSQFNRIKKGVQKVTQIQVRIADIALGWYYKHKWEKE